MGVGRPSETICLFAVKNPVLCRPDLCVLGHYGWFFLSSLKKEACVDCAPASWRAVAAVATTRSPRASTVRITGPWEAVSEDAQMYAVPVATDTNHPNVDTRGYALVWRPGRGGWWTMLRR